MDRRIAIMEEEGVEFRTNAHVGENPTTEELKTEFDAVVLAVGALQGRNLDVPGRELGGIHLAMDYLVQQNRRVAGLPANAEVEISAAGKNVVILGGGDTSADCLGNSHREGCASVKVLTHGPRPPDTPDHLTWPDWPFILHTYPAHEEGGERGFSVAVKGFSGSNGHVEKMHAVETERTPEGKTVPREGTDFEIETRPRAARHRLHRPRARPLPRKRWTSATPTAAPSTPRTVSARKSQASSSPATPGSGPT